MITPTNHPLVTLPAAAVSFVVGGLFGNTCYNQIQKIYEYTKCHFCEGIYSIQGTALIKEVNCYKTADILAYTLCATALSGGIALLAISLFATGVPEFIQLAFLAGSVALPLLKGILHIIGTNTGAHRDNTIVIPADKRATIPEGSITKRNLYGNYRYSAFPFPWSDQPQSSDYHDDL